MAGLPSHSSSCFHFQAHYFERVPLCLAVPSSRHCLDWKAGIFETLALARESFDRMTIFHREASGREGGG